MSAKERIGIALIVLGIVLFAVVVISIRMNMPDSGPLAGKITGYQPPFYGHGLLMVMIGIAAAGSFLAGLILMALGRDE